MIYPENCSNNCESLRNDGTQNEGNALDLDISQSDIPQSDISQSDISQSIVTRRSFLTAGTLVAATVALPQAALAFDSSPGRPGLAAEAKAVNAKTPVKPTTATTNCGDYTIPAAGTTFSEPDVWTPADSKLALTAELRNVYTSSVGFSVTQQFRSLCSFSAKLNPPTLKLDPTDTSANTISIDFTNDLPYDGVCVPNKPTCLNVSNLHFHGLHVSPSSTAAGVASDNVLIEVMTENDPSHPNKNTQEYCVVLPTFHAPGTHWYHPHRHGSTAIQVEDGMLGAIIVKEPDETHNMVPDSRDKVWVMQEIINGNVYTCGKNNCNAAYLVNGLYQPTITIQPGQWQRWRFINGTATPRGLMNLQLRKSGSNTPVNMYLIAVDGISFYGNYPQATTGWDMAPGNRADFLIWVQEPGTYEIFKGTYSGGGNNASKQTTQVLATVVVSGNDGGDSNPSTTKTIPGSFPPYLQPIRTSEVLNDSGTVRTKNINFNIPTKGNYQINNMQYSANSCDPSSPNSANCKQVDLNTAEVWYLSNIPEANSVGKVGSAHPFHIHVNPFQIVGDKINPAGPDDSSNWRWWDSIAVDPNACVPIVQRFTDYDGEFVLHCHILIHEDQGMMMNVKVNGNGTGACEQLSTPSFQPSGDDVITCDYVVANVTPPTINGKTCSNPLTCHNPSATTTNSESGQVDL